MLNGSVAPWPNFSEEEIAAVSDVLRSNKVNYWTGDIGRQFEVEFAKFAGTSHAIALANGTLALDLALYGTRVGSHNGGASDDEVIVTPRSFLASASVVVNAGARPVFADVDAESQNLSPQSVEQMITPKTKAIICVHLAGWPCDMDALRDVIGDRDIKLIEDCAQAHGATYKGRPVGCLGDVAAWSFCQDKIMTTGGEGGMLTCDDEDMWKRMWAYKDHGKSWDAVYNTQHPPGFRWLHEGFGSNFRLTEMQSAIGRIQLKRMPTWHEQRSRNAQNLAETLSPFAGPDGPLRLTRPLCNGCNGNCDDKSGCRHAYYKYYAFVRPQNLPDNMTRDDVIAWFNARNLVCMQGSCSEMYLEKAFDDTSFRPTQSLTVAKELGETSLMFLVHPGIEKVSIEESSF